MDLVKPGTSTSARAGPRPVPTRVIARLDIKGPNVIKGVRLEGLRVIGKPSEIARRYYDHGVDEIIYMDTVASLYERNNILDIVEEAARDIFVPLTVGGGLRSLDDITAALRSGADKVAINTEALKNPAFVNEAAAAFGSQCIVLSVEAKKWRTGEWEAYYDNGRERSGVDVLEWVVEAEWRGAGEILLTSVDQEGTKRGFDLELCAAVRARVRVPVIASGGAGDACHVVDLLAEPRADAVCCASLFHYDIAPVSALKQALAEAGHAVRR